MFHYCKASASLVGKMNNVTKMLYEISDIVNVIFEGSGYLKFISGALLKLPLEEELGWKSPLI